jgi:hypothetical protein
MTEYNSTNTEERIQQISNSFFSILDDFKRYYILSKLNPENEQYNNFYENIKLNIRDYSKELVLITKMIIDNLNNVNINMTDISNRLEQQKILNKRLLDMYSKLQQSENGSSLFIDDAKERYNNQYYKNINMLVGIIGLISGIFYLSQERKK